VELDPGNAVLYTSPAGLLAGPSAVATGPAGTYVADTGHGRACSSPRAEPPRSSAAA